MTTVSSDINAAAARGATEKHTPMDASGPSVDGAASLGCRHAGPTRYSKLPPAVPAVISVLRTALAGTSERTTAPATGNPELPLYITLHLVNNERIGVRWDARCNKPFGDTPSSGRERRD